ncbi:hypothetical protein GCM10023235_12800 [Kitasatospora terrestris]|uniref:TrbL/VirB6 plasmid conjugal transfer protein n=2 Tax=Kitasatospora terrestris TaxID=258051 RepID=A0ABP9DF77_9ACTN
MRRLAGLFLAVIATFTVIACPQPASADDSGIVGTIVEGMCVGSIGGLYGLVTDDHSCEKAGDAADKAVKEEWANVWNSVVGDWIKSAEDLARSAIRTALTFALQDPSLKLQDTGLFGADATLAGMMVWLGLVISTFGVMWQLGAMAITGKSRYLGRAMAGWAENSLLCVFGLSAVALLLQAGDEFTAGVVSVSFGDNAAAYDRIIAVMFPIMVAMGNPAIVAANLLVLLLIGAVQLLLIYLRKSAIPIQCLLLPIAGAGRTGGEATRRWAPRLITSILVCIAYKPIVAVILCVGFTEFGKAATFTEWLRGAATLVLAVLAPAPLTRIFAPLGADVGSGLAIGGAVGAVASVVGFVEQRRGGAGDGPAAGGGEPATAVEHARHVERSMGSGDRAGDGGDAVAQAARTGASQSAVIPGQSSGADGSSHPQPGTAAGGGTPSAGGAGLAIKVLDGVNNTVQRAADEFGKGGERS